ncbi:MAG TPA: hypothetical protein VNN62_07110 [Methylomirabilota bacterium]|nr:hypothetical protein [Methylomirabilota bacterium]
MDRKFILSIASLPGALMLSPGTSLAVPLASELRCPGIVDAQGIIRQGSTAHYARVVFKVLKPLQLTPQATEQPRLNTELAFVEQISPLSGEDLKERVLLFLDAVDTVENRRQIVIVESDYSAVCIDPF